VFFRLRRHKTARKASRVADDHDAGIHHATLRQTQQLLEWRRSAQLVTRAWNAWLAADARHSDARYRAFMAALATEATAAKELERMIGRGDAEHGAAAIDTPQSGLGAR
jgi:hypothetical protein